MLYNTIHMHVLYDVLQIRSPILECIDTEGSDEDTSSVELVQINKLFYNNLFIERMYYNYRSMPLHVTWPTESMVLETIIKYKVYLLQLACMVIIHVLVINI